MFTKDGTTTAGAGGAGASQPTARGSQKSTYIAPGTVFKGEITGQTELIVDGSVEGRLDLTGTVKVGPKGAVTGEIEARTVEVAGKVRGDIHGRERLDILASANIEGDLSSPRVVIADGAFFKGSVEMTGDAEAAKPTSPGAPQSHQGPARKGADT